MLEIALRRHLFEPMPHTTLDQYRELLMEKEEFWIEAYKLRYPQISPSGTFASWKQYRTLNKLYQRIGVVYCTWYQQISLGIRSRYPAAEHGAIQFKSWGLTADSLHVRSDEDDRY